MIKASCASLHYQPREGHPAKEGLRQAAHLLPEYPQVFPREGHPAKEGLRRVIYAINQAFNLDPERVIQQKRD